MKSLTFLILSVLLLAGSAYAEVIRTPTGGLTFTSFGINSITDTLFGAADSVRVDTFYVEPPPGTYATAWFVKPNGTAGGDDSLVVKYRPLGDVADIAGTAGSAFRAIPWYLTSTTSSTMTGVLDFTDNSWYDSDVPDSVAIATSVQPFRPIPCAVWQVTVATGTTDTVAYTIRWITRYIHE